MADAPKPVVPRSPPSQPKPSQPNWDQLQVNQKPPNPNAAKVDPGRIVNFTAPFCIIISGCLLEIILAVFHAGGFTANISRTATDLLARTLLIFICVFLASFLCRFKLGPLPTAALKLAAISVATLAIFDLLHPFLLFLPALPIMTFAAVSSGVLAGWALQLVIVFTLLGLLFEIHEQDIWYCIGLLFISCTAIHFWGVWTGDRNSIF